MDIFERALYLYWRCRSENIQPLGWGVDPLLWDDMMASISASLWIEGPAATPKLYGLPVEVSGVYTGLSIRII